MHQKTLILGASGQIGTELALALRENQDPETILATDIREGAPDLVNSGPFAIVDALDPKMLAEVVEEHKIEVIYLMAAMLSANAEKAPEKAWNLNMQSLFHVLELGKMRRVKKIFWPSSISVFGPGSPLEKVPQETIMDPTTVYGISKLAGDRWCAYYYLKHGVDVRSLRYPGLISWKTEPGGGTTDYAIEMYQHAAANTPYTCFLGPETRLPMMYMDDAIRATLELMNAKAEILGDRTSYNLAAFSFTPRELFENIKKIKPNFTVDYQPDFRQQIADSWPRKIDDQVAREDWGWQHEYDLDRTAEIMLKKLG